MELPLSEGLKAALRRHATLGDVVLTVIGLCLLGAAAVVSVHHTAAAAGMKAADVELAQVKTNAEVSGLKEGQTDLSTEVGAVRDETHVVHLKLERISGALDVRMPSELPRAETFTRMEKPKR